MINQVPQKKKSKTKPLLLLPLLICFSCNKGETYYRFNDIKSEGWYSTDTLKFEIDSTLINQDAKYDITIEIVNNTEYLYQNLWLYVNTDLTSPQQKLEQKEYMLADSLGKWYGAGFGSTYQLSLSFKKGISFPVKKNYTINIIHGMKDEPLRGLEKVGVKLQLHE